MELARDEGNPAPSGDFTEASVQRTTKHQKCKSIEQAQQSPDDELRMLKPNKGDNGLCQTRERHCANKRARHRTREVEVVIAGGESLAGRVADGGAVDEDVVRGLEVE